MSHKLTLDALAAFSLGPKQDETSDDFALRVAGLAKAAVEASPVVGGKVGEVDPAILAAQASDAYDYEKPEVAIDLEPAADYLGRLDGFKKDHAGYVADARKHNAALAGGLVQLGIAGLTAAAGPGGGKAAGQVLVTGLMSLGKSALADSGT